MSNWAQAKREAAEAAFASLAEVWSFTPKGGAPRPVRVRIRHDVQTVGEFEQVVEPYIEGKVLKSEAGDIGPGALLELEGTRYEVDAIVEDNGTTIRVVLLP